MAKTVFVDGAEGTTGLRILQRLSGHAGIQVRTLPSETRKQLPARLQAVAQADVSMLCLPDAAALELAAAAPKGARLCDASTAHRTTPGWVYGFAELKGHRQAIAAAARVCVPGCHATGFLALCAPLVRAGLLNPAAPLCCNSLTGYSGGGKQMIAAYEDPRRPAAYAAPRQYALGLQHKHLPEMQAVAALAAPPVFSPVVADYYSGMLVSLPLQAAWLGAGVNTPDKLADFFTGYYGGEALIHVKAEMPADGTLDAGALNGRDDLELFVLGNQRQLLLAARFDNLGKGASGAALQCLNLMLGLPETDGLVCG